MPGKGASTKLQPMRLPPLKQLRVRRPNAGEANPCLTIMSAVLCTSPFPICKMNREADKFYSMLGIVGVYIRWMPGFGDAIEGVYGCACKSFQ
jgi:hypothetical protein